jgi:hypothetical protein
LIQGYQGLKERVSQIPQEAQIRLTEALRRLVQLYEAWGKPDQAAQWRQQLAGRQSPPKP